MCATPYVGGRRMLAVWVMRRVLLCMPEAVEFSKFAGGSGGDTLHPTLCGG